MFDIFEYIVSGTSDGQTKVVREGDNGVAYAWSLREQKWDKVIYVFVLTSISAIMVTLYAFFIISLMTF